MFQCLTSKDLGEEKTKKKKKKRNDKLNKDSLVFSQYYETY